MNDVLFFVWIVIYAVNVDHCSKKLKPKKSNVKPLHPNTPLSNVNPERVIEALKLERVIEALKLERKE